MNWAHLEKFLELIHIYNMDFKMCPQHILYNNFKNNEYYSIKAFCEVNNLITTQYKEIELTSKGRDFFNFLKKCRLVYK
jgi:hypothetical protein